MRTIAGSSGQRGSRSIRTTCCLAEWTPPARIRVLTGVRYSRARTICERSTRAWNDAEQASRFRIASDQAREARTTTERRDVVRRVAGAAGHDLRSRRT